MAPWPFLKTIWNFWKSCRFRITQRDSFTQCPPAVTFCSTIVQLHNRHIDRGWHNPLILFRSPQFYLPSCVWVLSSVQFYCLGRFMLSPPWSRHRKVPSQGSLCSPFIDTHLLLLTPAVPNLQQPLTCFPFLYFSCQQNYINGVIQNVSFGDWLFFSTQHNSLQTHPSKGFIQIAACVNSWTLFIAN